MKIAICQINTMIGDFDGNAERMAGEIDRAKGEGADLAVFPELTTCGYPPRDLLEKPLFIERNLECVEQVAKHAQGIAAVIGFVVPNETQTGRGLYNVAGLLENGRVAFTQEKSLLPEYDVFDEARHFEPARSHRVHKCAGRTLALSLCEDIWSDYTFEGRRLYKTDPIKDYVDLGAEVIISISASPYVLGKGKVRQNLAQQTARRNGKPVIYCNLVGGNDELIFDGQSMAINAKGELVWLGKCFEEDHVVIDTDKLVPLSAHDSIEDVVEIKEALILGIRDYMRKCGFAKAVIGLSGGIDSAVVATLASQAVGPENIIAVMMPSPYSSKESLVDAKELADRLGIETRVIPIDDVYNAYRRTMGIEGKDVSVVEENLQARTRGSILMAISNREGALVLSTGNKSELAVGYCTLYGDMAGGLAVISDVPKTLVYRVARYFNEAEGLIPSAIIEKPPSAELKPDQADQDVLPSYDLLDQILKLHIEDHMSSRAIIDIGYDAEIVKRVVNMVANNEYKRRQSAPGLKVTSKAFGSGRRFPIARKMYW